VLHALGVGLEQALQYVGRCTSTFEEFERWIIAAAGEPEALQVQRINAAEIGDGCPEKIGWRLREFEANAPLLSADDLAFWEEHGYVVVADAVPTDARERAAAAVLMRVGANGRRSGAWYGQRTNGVMVQYFQHPALRPSETHGVSTRHSHGSGAPLICG
jgi:hypothetical protein